MNGRQNYVCVYMTATLDVCHAQTRLKTMSLLSQSTEPPQAPSVRLDPETARWLYDLTQDLPDDLIDPKELDGRQEVKSSTEQPVDPFMEDVRRLMHANDNVKWGDGVKVDLPLTSEEADIVDRATAEMPAPRRKMKKAAPTITSRLQKRRKRELGDTLYEEPAGYQADYSFADEWPSDRSLPKQTGRFSDKPTRTEKEKLLMRRMLNAARQQRRRDRSDLLSQDSDMRF